MSDPTPQYSALKLMQERLEGVENNTTELAKMLLDLGISPTASPTAQLQFPELQVESKNSKNNEKSVRFGGKKCKLQTKTVPQPILKKSTIKPLQVNINSLNAGGDNAANQTPEQYSKVVSRLCKTESMVQSLKLSMSALKASHEASDKEKNMVLDKLKEEIYTQEVIIKKQKEALLEEQKRSKDHIMRWEEAEKEVKELNTRLQVQASIVKESGCGDDALREKFTRKLDEAKQELAREKEVRIALEDSHQSLLSRVQDMEDAIEHERNLNDTLRGENKKLREANEMLKTETSNFHLKAEELAKQLASLTEELQSKEKAIRRLIEEQQQFQTNSSSLANEQVSLNKELKQCNIVLEVQKAAFAQLEAENLKLKKEVDEARLFKLESEQDQARKCEEEEIKKNEERINKQQFEERLKGEMNLAVKNEKKKYRELEDRNKLLEECIKEQERIMNLKEQEYNEREKQHDEKLFEEKKKTARFMKESEQAIRAKENVIKDLNRASNDVGREKELLQQQIEEVKLELEGLIKERSHLGEENQRLLNRIATVEQQEQVYKRAQEAVNATSNAKTQLAYENGKLQTRVEQLEDELRQMASVQSQLVQLRAANRAFEHKYAQVTSELAAVKVESQRNDVFVKQLQGNLTRKEDDFNLAISARDEAVRDKDAILVQIETLKEQQKNKVSLLKRDLHDCRLDNERLTMALNDVTQHQNEMQETLNGAQAQLGRKDAQIACLVEEKRKLDKELGELQSAVGRMQSALDARDVEEQSRISPALEALERAKEENMRLTSSLEDAIKRKEDIEAALDKHKTDLEIQRERVTLLLRQQEANEREANVTSQTQAERLQQMKDQFAKERSAIRKQLQLQITELKKANESSHVRNSQLTKGNTDLRSKVANLEQTVGRLKDKIKQQKSALERHQSDKRSNFNTVQKLKAIDDELKDLEKSKLCYIEKNKQQQEVIATFNTEVTSLKDDITALSEAHQLARERNKKLELQVEKERSDKEILSNKIKTLEEAIKRAIKDKKNAEEKLRKVEIESIHVQENLQEAQAWFQGKFTSLQNELAKRK